jgi:hypothetical protein
VAVDAVGNVIVTGLSWGTNSIRDYTVKYAASDGRLLWDKRLQLFTIEYARLYPRLSLAVDAAGNAAVIHSVFGTNSNSDFYTVKFASSDGTVLWEQRYDGPSFEAANIAHSGVARAVTFAPDSNVVVMATLGYEPISLYTAKYAASNGTPIWEQHYEGVEGRAMAVDSSGNAIVTGYFVRFELPAVSKTIKYGASDGAVLWELELGGNAIAVDHLGNVFITGERTMKLAAEDGAVLWEQKLVGGAAVAVDQNGDVIIRGSGLAKCSGIDGTLLWGSSPANYIIALALDASGDIAITGYGGTAKLRGADGSTIWNSYYFGSAIAVDAGGNIVVVGSDGGGHTFNIIHYTRKFAAADGALLWEQGDGGPTDHSILSAVAIDSAGNVVATGYSDPSTDAPCLGDCYLSFDKGDYYTVKYAAADGAILWEKQYNGPANGGDYVYGDSEDSGCEFRTHHVLAVGPDDSVVIIGASDGNPGERTAYEIATVKYAMTQVTYPTQVVLSLALTSEGARLRFTGDAGRTYRLQRTSDPAGPWTTFAAFTAPPNGAVEHLDSAPPASPTFYRITAP